MSNLVEFLRAQIAKDEAVARAASGGEWAELVPEQPFVVFDVEAYRARKTQTTVGAVASVSRAEDRAHIARHNPARVLREAEAKRRILARHRTDPERAGDRVWARACIGCGTAGDCDDPATEDIDECPELLDMASVYKNGDPS